MQDSKLYSVEDLLDVVREGKEPPECDKTMKVQALSAVDGIAKGIWHIDHTFLNGHGVAMGGFVSSAADIMMAYAMASKLKPEQGFSSISLHTTFHRPILLGTAEVEARVERLGKTVAYVEATLVQGGKIAATLTSSVLIIS